jgi:hypothetical protein
MNFGSLLIFLGLNKLKNEFLNPRTVSGSIRPEATAHRMRWPAMCGLPKGWLSLGLAARSGGEAAGSAGTACVSLARSRRIPRGHDDALADGSVVAGWWQGAAGELTGATGRVPGKVVRGGAHPSGDAAWRWWRMRRAAAFNDGEAWPCIVGLEEGR